MMRGFLLWLLLSVGMALGIMQVRAMTGREVWSSLKTLGFGALCSALALLVIFVIVILF